MDSTSDSASIYQFSEALATAVERAGAYTVTLNARRRIAASGVVWAEGVVVVADHAVEQDDELSVRMPDGSVARGTIAGRDPSADIAVLRVEGTPEPAPRGSAAAPRIGHLVLAVGRPGGGSPAASLGIVSAIISGASGARRGHDPRSISELIVTDATLYPGFSGGPLVDPAGLLLGVNTLALRHGVTVPLGSAGTIVEQLLAHGRVRRAYLGITSRPVHLPAHAAESNGQPTALLVVGVEEDSPAARSGALIGDILIAIDAQPTRDTEDLRAALAFEHAGLPVTLHILRAGNPLDLATVLGER